MLSREDRILDALKAAKLFADAQQPADREKRNSIYVDRFLYVLGQSGLEVVDKPREPAAEQTHGPCMQREVIENAIAELTATDGGLIAELLPAHVYGDPDPVSRRALRHEIDAWIREWMLDGPDPI